MPFINFRSPEDERWDKLNTGIGNLIDRLGSGFKQRKMQEDRAQALDALMPGLGKSAALPDTLLAEQLRMPRMQQQAQAKESSKLSPIASKELKEAMEGGNIAKEIVSTIGSLKENLPHTATGALAGRIPSEWRGAKGQKFIRDLNKLVELGTMKIPGGRLTNAILKLKQAAKISPTMNQEAIADILQDILDEPGIKQSIARAEAARNLEEEWQGNYPRNYRTLLNKAEEQLIGKEYPSQTEKFKKGTVRSFVNNKTGETKKAYFDGKNWVER